jgi:hypothetical protein
MMRPRKPSKTRACSCTRWRPPPRKPSCRKCHPGPDRSVCPSSELSKRDSLVRRRGPANDSVMFAGIPKIWSPISASPGCRSCRAMVRPRGLGLRRGASIAARGIPPDSDRSAVAAGTHRRSAGPGVPADSPPRPARGEAGRRPDRADRARAARARDRPEETPDLVRPEPAKESPLPRSRWMTAKDINEEVIPTNPEHSRRIERAC